MSAQQQIDVTVNGGEEAQRKNNQDNTEKAGGETLDLTMGQTIEFKKYGNDASHDQATGTLPNTTKNNFNDGTHTQAVNTHADIKEDGDMSIEPMSALPAVTSVQKITLTPGPNSKPSDPVKNEDSNPKLLTKGGSSQDNKLSMKQALGMVINKKNLHGGAHPERKALQVSQMIADPDSNEIDELGNPLDYFSIYKQEMKKLAHQKFDEEQDHQFFSYLDRLVFAEKYRKEDRIDGLGILREFVTDKASLTYVKRRNEQIRRWQQAREARVERGDPADPPEADDSMMKALLEELNAKQVKRVLNQKTFVPEIVNDQDNKQGSAKNYIIKERFGRMRNFRPPWQDPNPLKYGGQYGMQRMKEMVDTGYMRGKAEHIRRQEIERQQAMTDEQLLLEEQQNLKMKMLADQSKSKLTDLNDEKKYEIVNTLEPQERSFLIQPEKSLKARLPSIFSANNQSPANTSKVNSPMNQSNSNLRIDQYNRDDVSNNQNQINPGSSNQSFLMPDATQNNQFGFGKRSQSMAAPNLGMPQSVRHADMKGDAFALQLQDQLSRQTLDVFGKSGGGPQLQQDPSRQAIENYKSMLQNQGSSKHLLSKIQSEYTSMRSIQEQNDERYIQNQENLKYSQHETNNIVLNPPIKEGYEHKRFKGPSDLEGTVKLSFALEELRKDPSKMRKMMGISPGPKVKYTLRHGRSPIQSDASKLRLFDNLTKDVQKLKTDRKKNQSQAELFGGSVTTKSAMEHRGSSFSTAQLTNQTDGMEAIGFWDKPFYAIMAQNGSEISDKRTKSIKLNLSKFIKKYQIDPPKFIARLPDEFIKSQSKFFERAYMEILEYCNTHLDTRKKSEKHLKSPEFITMFTSDGQHLKTIEDIQNFITGRKLEILDEAQDNNSIQRNESSQFKLPEIKKPSFLEIPMQSPSVASIDKKVNKQRKAQFISYSPSANSNMFEQSQLSQKLSGVDLPPPLILVSLTTTFHGIAQSKEGYSTSQLRESNANEVKDRIDVQKGDWGNKQILNWIESNVESGRSEPYNMEAVLQQDSQSKYPHTNSQYRDKIARRLGGSSSVEKMKPVYTGGGLQSAKNFLLPIIEEGAIENLRKKFGGTIDIYEQEREQQEIQRLNLIQQNQMSQMGAFSSKFNKRHSLVEQANNSNIINSRSAIGQGLYGSQSHLQLHESPSQFSVATGGVGQTNPWDQDMISKVEMLKQQFIANQMSSKTDRNHRISPDKGNFEQLSYQHSLATLNKGGAQFRSSSIANISQSPHSGVSGSLKKIVGSFNLQLDQQAVDKLKKGQAAKYTGGKKPHVSKNIPHLQLDKKKNQKRDILSYEQVQVLADNLKLPTSTIYQLRTEYECLKDLGEEDALTDIQILGGQTSIQEGEDEDAEPPSTLEGIQVPAFLKTFQPLKEAHRLVVQKVLGSLGIQNSRASVIDWDLFLKIQSLFKYHTATREVYIDFWQKFFNLYNQPEVEKSEVLSSLELLARGCYTETSTMVSDAYAESVYEMLQEQGCTVAGPNGEVVDMVIFKKKLAGGAIDVERLNQCLKHNSEEGPPETDATNAQMTAQSHLGPFDDKSSIQKLNDNSTEIFN